MSQRKFTPYFTPIRAAIAATAALAAALAFSTAASAATPQLPLKTQGAKIVDSGGQEVVLQGVNWFGFETSNHAPHGLWSRDYKDMLAQIKGQPPSLIDPPTGCRFRARCPHAFDRCAEQPELEPSGDVPGHLDRCWLSAEQKTSLRLGPSGLIGLEARAE